MDVAMESLKMCSMDYCLSVSDEVVAIDSLCDFKDIEMAHPSFMTSEEYVMLDEPIRNLIERFLR